MYLKKWSVRGVDPESVKKLMEVKKVSGGALGQLLNEAIDFWYDSLETVDESSAADILLVQVGHNMAHSMNDAASQAVENEKQ